MSETTVASVTKKQFAEMTKRATKSVLADFEKAAKESDVGKADPMLSLTVLMVSAFVSSNLEKELFPEKIELQQS